MTRLGIIVQIYSAIEAPPSRFTATGEYMEWRERAIEWAGDRDIWDLYHANDYLKAMAS
jgi:hypothetical protein